MNIISFAEKELGMNLSYFQKDLLEILERDGEGIRFAVKPYTNDVRKVLIVMEKWKQQQERLVPC